MILSLITRAVTDFLADLRTLAGDYLAALNPERPTPVGTWPCGGVDECYCGTDRDVRGQFVGYVSGPDGIEDRDDPFGAEHDDYPLGEYPPL